MNAECQAEAADQNFLNKELGFLFVKKKSVPTLCENFFTYIKKFFRMHLVEAQEGEGGETPT